MSEEYKEPTWIENMNQEYFESTSPLHIPTITIMCRLCGDKFYLFRSKVLHDPNNPPCMVNESECDYCPNCGKARRIRQESPDKEIENFHKIFDEFAEKVRFKEGLFLIGLFDRNDHVDYEWMESFITETKGQLNKLSRRLKKMKTSRQEGK